MQTTSERASIVIDRAEQDEDAAAGEDGEGAEERAGSRRRRASGRRAAGRGAAAARRAARPARWRASDSSCRPRETVAKPDWVASSGGRTSLLERAVERRHRVAHRRRQRHVVVDDDQRLRRRPGRSAATVPRSQGEITVAVGSRRRARTSGGPWRSIAASGPLEQDGELASRRRSALGELFPRGRNRCRRSQRERVELVLDAEPDDAEHAATEQHGDHRRERPAELSPPASLSRHPRIFPGGEALCERRRTGTVPGPSVSCPSAIGASMLPCLLRKPAHGTPTDRYGGKRVSSIRGLMPCT